MGTVLLFLLVSALPDSSFSEQFFYVHSTMTWSQAQTYCRIHYTDLATIHNLSENDEVANLAGDLSTWIGMYKTNDHWIWSDQSDSQFSNWDVTEPKYQTEPCVALRSNKWYSKLCSQNFYFVCYVAPLNPALPSTMAPPISVMTTPTATMTPPVLYMAPPTPAPPTEMKKQILRLKVTSDENVNDPEVKKKVLEKIQQILKMKGLDGNATLSWRNQSDGNVFQTYQEYNVSQQICH